MPQPAAVRVVTDARLVAALTAYDLIAPRIPQVPANTTWLTTYQAGHPWTTNDATHVDLNSTAVQLFGSQGVRFHDSSANSEIYWNGPNVDLTGKQLVLALRTLDDNGLGLMIYLKDASLNIRQFGISDPSRYRTEDGWTIVTIDPLSIGGTFDLTTVNSWTIRFLAPSVPGNHIEYLAGLGTAPLNPLYPNGVVMIDFDDNAPGQWELARPLMIARGFVGTICTIGANADALLGSGSLDVPAMHVLEDIFGWEIGGHAPSNADHVDMTTLTQTQLDDFVLRTREWLINNRFKSNYFAYPVGSNNGVVRATIRKHFSLARTVGIGDQDGDNPPILDSRVMALPALVSAATPTAQLAYVDTIAATKQSGTLLFHSVVSGASNTTDIGVADLTSILDRIVTKGCAVVTPSTLYGIK